MTSRSVCAQAARRRLSIQPSVLGVMGCNELFPQCSGGCGEIIPTVDVQSIKKVFSAILKYLEPPFVLPCFKGSCTGPTE